jgi:indolepyruvate ferredoxin oxidoreductase beta subunit
MIDEFNALIAGVGGQGNMLAARIVADAALELGYQVRMAETFGGAQRGGAVFSLVRIGTAIRSPTIAEDELQTLIGLEPVESIRHGVEYLSPNGSALINTTPVMPVDVNVGKVSYPPLDKIVADLKRVCKSVYALDGTSLAIKSGEARAMNICMIATASELGLIPIEPPRLKNAMYGRLKKSIHEVNSKAFDIALEAARKLKPC